MKPPVFSLLSSRVTNNGSLYGRFLLGPLPIDVSVTLATILRRSLLHSQESLTIISAEIEGANHEYASLPGIQESVLEILLNLGEIVLTSPERNLLDSKTKFSLFSDVDNRIPSNSQPYIAFLRISGPCVVTAKDIKWPIGIQCVKPNAHIATLSNNATLAMRIKIVYPLTSKKHLQLESFGLRNNLASEKASLNSSSSKAQSTGASFISFTKNNNNQHFKNNLKPQILSDNLNPPEYNRILGKTLRNRLPLWGSQTSGFLRSGGKYINSAISSPEEKGPQAVQEEDPVNLSSFSNNPNLRLKQTLYAEGLQNRISGFSTSFEKLYENHKKKKSLSVNIETKEKSLDSFGKPSIQLQNNEHFNKKNKKQFEKEPLSERRHFSKKTYKYISSKQKPFQSGEAKAVEPISRKPLGIELPVSSSSQPVEKVNFLIERDDSLGGYRHRIIFEVWTNGSISPRQAIFESIGWIIRLLYNFREPTRSSFLFSP